MENPWLWFIGSVILVVYAAIKLSHYASIISAKSSLGGFWVGSALLAGATSLPEVVASVTSGIMGLPDIAVGNVFGSNIFNLANIALMDIIKGGTPILALASAGHIMSATLGMVLSALAAVAILLKSNISIFGVGIDTIIIIGVYAIGLKAMASYSKGEGSEEGEGPKAYQGASLKKAYLGFGIGALVVMVAGTALTISGDEIARITGLGGTFVGSILIAASTSLPETVAGITAVRMGAINLALGNFFGSNIFNMIILFISDMALRGAPILSVVGPVHAVTALFGLILSGVAIMGLLVKSKKKILGMGVDSATILGLYIFVTYLLFKGI